MTWTTHSLSDISILSRSIHDMSTVSSKLYWQNLEWQTIMDLNLHHTHDFLALWRASFKQSEVGPSESNGRENYWNIQLFMSCFRRVRCRCFENLTTKFLKGHTNYSWSKQSWAFSTQRTYCSTHWKCRTECFCQHYSYPKMSKRKLLEFLLEINCIICPEGQYHFPLKTRRMVFCTTPQLNCSTVAAEGNLDQNIYHRAIT